MSCASGLVVAFFKVSECWYLSFLDSHRILVCLPVIKVGRNAPELSSLAPHNRHLAFLGRAPNLLSSCRNFGLWLAELCSEGGLESVNSTLFVNSILYNSLGEWQQMLCKLFLRKKQRCKASAVTPGEYTYYTRCTKSYLLSGGNTI